MKALSIIVLSLVVVSPAYAEKVRCSFTEPFILVEIDTEKGTGSVSSPVEEETESFKDLKVIDFGASKYSIDLAEQTLSLDLNTEGSDGMSDYVFPISATLTWSKAEAALVGGCESDLRKGHCPADIPDCR